MKSDIDQLLTYSAHLDLLRIPHLLLAHVDAEGRVGDVLAHALDGYSVLANLTRSERNANVSSRQALQEAGFF